MAARSLKPPLTMSIVALLLAVPIAASISGAFAQDTTSETAGTVEVYADGTVLVEPDAASIVIGVDINQPNLADAQAESDATSMAA